MYTGHDLSGLAYREDAWLAVQASGGGVADTRAGDLRVDALGCVLTGAGHPVMGDSGPLAVPPNFSVSVRDDGTATVIPLGRNPATPEPLRRGEDGLMRSASADTPLVPAAGNAISSGMLEGSNVNIADWMVTLIRLARQFELHTKLMRTAEEHATAASTLVRMRG